MPFYVYAWIATIIYGFVTILAKLTTKYGIKNPYLFTFLYSLFILLSTVPFALANHVGIPDHWGNLIAASICIALAFTFYSLALYRLDASVLSPLFNFRIAFSLFLAAFVLGEVLNVGQYLLIGVLFIAGVVVTIDEAMHMRSFFNKSVGMAFIAMIFIALVSVFLKRSVAEIGYWEYTLWSVILAQIILLVTVPFFIKDIAKITRKQIGAITVLAFVDMLGTLANNKAYAKNVSITSVILAIPTGMILAYVLSIFAPKLLEKHTRKIYLLRFAAAAVMVLVGLRLSG